MKYLLRLDLAHIRRNLERVNGFAFTDDDVLRTLATRGVWRQSDDWWGATESALTDFREGEIVQKVHER